MNQTIYCAYNRIAMFRLNLNCKSIKFAMLKMVHYMIISCNVRDVLMSRVDNKSCNIDLDRSISH